MAEAVASPTYNPPAIPSEDEEDENDYKEYSSENDLSEEEKSEIVNKLDKMFRYAADNQSWIRGRHNMIKAFRYREGEQWSTEELRELADRHQPDTVNNQISVVVNRLVGELVNQRFRVGFKGRNAAPDDGLAAVISDLLMHLRQSNDMEFEERDMAEDGFTGGLGVLDLSVTFDDLGQPEIKVRHEDPLIVFPDPDSRRYDWNEDARFVARAKWWSIDEAAETYPHAEIRLRGMGSIGGSQGDNGGSAQLSGVDAFKGEKYIDSENQRIRLIEVQYKKMEREQVLLLSNGNSAVIKEEDKGAAKKAIKEAKAQGLTWRWINRVKSRICVGVYAAGVLLEHTVTDHKYFSLVPYWAYRRKTGEPYSLVTLALSMQDAINKRESKALHLLNTNQALYEKSAVDDPETMASERARPDGNVELRDGALSQQRFVIKDNLELANSQYSMHQKAQQDLYSIVGMDPRMGQSTGELRSGSGLKQKYQEASKPVATLFDNIRRTHGIFARVALDLMQKYYTGEKVFLITDDENAQKQVGISADQMEQLKNGLYDVVVGEFEDDDTVQDESFRVMAETLPNLLQFPPVYVKMMIQASRMRNKGEILKMLEAQDGPPPLMPKMNLQANLDGLDPVERAAIWTMMGKPEIAQQLMQQPPLTTQQVKAQTELQKAQIGKPDAGTEQATAAMEIRKEQLKFQMEAEKLQAEHEVKMRELQMKLDADSQKHQMSLEIANTKMQHDVVRAAIKPKKGESK